MQNTKHIKLSPEGLKALRESIGVPQGRINLTTGVVSVDEKTFQQVAEKLDKNYGIENINLIPYNFTSNLMNQNVMIGSIVKIRFENVVKHVIVIEMNGDCYKCAFVNLGESNFPNVVKLRKGTDVNWKNPTYKDVVEVLPEIIKVKFNDVIKTAGIVAGRVINETKMMQILDSNDTPKIEKRQILRFESVVENSVNVDNLIGELGISAQQYLKTAIRLCLVTKSCNLRKLVKQIQDSCSLSQKAIRELLENEFFNWRVENSVLMNQESLSYFLKTIVKKLK